jgi:hypothetical protein
VTKISRLINPPQSDTERAAFPTDNGDTRKPVHEKHLQFEANEDQPSSMRRPGEGPAFEEILRWLARSFAILALLSSFALLCVGATPFLTPLPAHIAKALVHVWALVKDVPLSAPPLLLAGSSYIVLQAILRPQPLELLKRLMLGTAFLLWGVVQLMPAGNLSTELGNVVIALYVVDLGLIIWTELEEKPLKLVR